MTAKIFNTIEEAFTEAMKHLEGEHISAVEIHWGHGTITLKQSSKGWKLIDDS